MRKPTQQEQDEVNAAFRVLKKYLGQPGYVQAFAEMVRFRMKHESWAPSSAQVIRWLFENDYPPPLPLQPEPPTLSQLVSDALDKDIQSRETLPPVNLGSFSKTMPSPAPPISRAAQHFLGEDVLEAALVDEVIPDLELAK